MGEDPLKTVGKLAQALDDPGVSDNLSPSQWRLLRECTDNLRSALQESLGDLTPPLLVALMLGATIQANLEDGSDPVSSVLASLGVRRKTPGEEQPHSLLLLMLGLLSQDLLTEGPGA
jgi:hypothetical protein